jgi:outer membrane lipoprotein SlyB
MCHGQRGQGPAAIFQWLPLARSKAPAPQPYYDSQATRSHSYPAPASARYNTGYVERIEIIRKDAGRNIAGTVIGGVVGGLIGHQIGGGSGRTAATIIGATCGAIAGNQIDNRPRREDETFRVTVRYDNGTYHTLHQENITNLRTGDRVRVEDGRIYRI